MFGKLKNTIRLYIRDIIQICNTEYVAEIESRQEKLNKINQDVLGLRTERELVQDEMFLIKMNISHYRNLESENKRLRAENADMIRDQLQFNEQKAQYDKDIAYLLSLTKRTRQRMAREGADNGRKGEVRSTRGAKRARS